MDEPLFQFTETPSQEEGAVTVNVCAFPAASMNQVAAMLNRANYKADEFVSPFICLSAEDAPAHFDVINSEYFFHKGVWKRCAGREKLLHQADEAWRKEMNALFVLPENFDVAKYLSVLLVARLECADKSIKEIYVFEITVKERYVPETFIKELDKSIKLHTLFCVKHENYKLSMISYKLGTQKGKYWQTNWENADAFDVPLVSNIPEMYKYILSKFLAYPPFDSESVDEYVKRYNQLAKLDFQIGKTESAIAHETQSKKRFEYNARLKEYKTERERLIK
jgi:hypothetical protein